MFNFKGDNANAFFSSVDGAGLLSHFTADAAGGFRVESHFQPQGVSGIGLTSSDKYQGAGVTRSYFKVSGLPFNSTFVNNFRIIGQRRGNNFLVHEN